MELVSFLSGLLLPPTWVSRLQGRVRPNPYAPNVPDQARVAAAQLGTVAAAAGELLPPLQDRAFAGSEADYWTNDQLSVNGWGDPIAQPIAGNPGKPASWYVPGDPGADPRDPLTLADFDRSPNPNMTPWGGSTRTINTGNQRALTGRLNPPTMVTPGARDVYQAGVARGDVLARMWED